MFQQNDEHDEDSELLKELFDNVETPAAPSSPCSGPRLTSNDASTEYKDAGLCAVSKTYTGAYFTFGPYLSCRVHPCGTLFWTLAMSRAKCFSTRTCDRLLAAIKTGEKWCMNTTLARKHKGSTKPSDLAAPEDLAHLWYTFPPIVKPTPQQAEHINALQTSDTDEILSEEWASVGWYRSGLLHYCAKEDPLAEKKVRNTATIEIRSSLLLLLAGMHISRLTYNKKAAEKPFSQPDAGQKPKEEGAQTSEDDEAGEVGPIQNICNLVDKVLVFITDTCAKRDAAVQPMTPSKIIKAIFDLIASGCGPKVVEQVKHELKSSSDFSNSMQSAALDFFLLTTLDQQFPQITACAMAYIILARLRTIPQARAICGVDERLGGSKAARFGTYTEATLALLELFTNVIERIAHEHAEKPNSMAVSLSNSVKMVRRNVKEKRVHPTMMEQCSAGFVPHKPRRILTPEMKYELSILAIDLMSTKHLSLHQTLGVLQKGNKSKLNIAPSTSRKLESEIAGRYHSLISRTFTPTSSVQISFDASAVSLWAHFNLFYAVIGEKPVVQNGRPVSRTTGPVVLLPQVQNTQRETRIETHKNDPRISRQCSTP